MKNKNIIKKLKACSLLLLVSLCIAVPMNASAEKGQVDGYGTYYNNGNIYSNMLKDYAKAEECYKKAIQTNPQNGDAYCNLGLLYYDYQQDYVRAEEYFKKAIQINPQNAAAYYNLGVLYYTWKQDYVKAKEYFKKAGEINPHTVYVS